MVDNLFVIGGRIVNGMTSERPSVQSALVVPVFEVGSCIEHTSWRQVLQSVNAMLSVQNGEQVVQRPMEAGIRLQQVFRSAKGMEDRRMVASSQELPNFLEARSVSGA